MPPLNFVRPSVLVAFALAATACVVRSERTDNGGGYVGGGASGGSMYGDGGNSAGPAGTAASPTPILVRIDTGKTMNASPGEGVGIFTEYAAGGHWHVWWTCDTNKTNLPCTFDLRVSGAAMSNLQQEAPLAGDTATFTKPDQLDIHAETTSNVSGVRFDTSAGDTIQLEAQVGGVADASFFFFVQDGKVNGGYAGKLTNPLLFEGRSP